MSVDIMFYIQKKVEDKWEDIKLFTKDSERVEIWRCGWDTWDIIKDTWNHSGMTEEDIVRLALEVDLYHYGDEPETLPQNCWISLTKLELFQYLKKFSEVDTPDEAEDTRRFYKTLYDEIQCYINFAENGFYGSSDNVRIVAFACQGVT